MSDGTEPAQFKPPANDPWKGFRGVCSGTLILEAIVVLLALPVVATVGGGLSWFSTTYIVGVAILLMLAPGVQGRPQAMQINLILQALVLAGVFIHLSIGIVGVVFGAVWAYLIYLRRDITRRIERGMLYGQRD
ncbi:DUF4233 domain-containing protein [Rhodococcus sp. BP-252]|uniref:DUF4233 domain-containing protein n=1 Tax=unclassified Rhodococcus (in: high G+C Gram-positive bacteria) TaxID=192944 RepID=UPI000DF15A60|nr:MULTISPECIES: DUF4233 domain-containing protein [unclassified Rhodococcus (in: high G+C Gram-positive bacteria)]MBY6412091.1 DUF4233 domain-containing protein [Rhodococcus sp. BP-320]MBY6416671.1 DUF4233 domain-containing protein [Rhodococcus sp. BP-321]MBY6421140.1 DUF4233 domain-containing protein [Rhodococcus sp. BP-324]MBY6426695.1 DUF4233 domain-containing protein [Rhodococcus sp. BP-323]MBY6431694.1 DUF4233 domain-containing protein [Rhodococcus sp. BP-322]